MRIKLNNESQTFNILGDPHFTEPLRFILDVDKAIAVHMPIRGEVKVVDDITWPDKTEPEEFLLFSTNASNWKHIDLETSKDGDGNNVYTLVFTNVDPAPEPTPEEKERERLRKLEEDKENRIAESKSMLAQFLADNPLLWKDGKYYSVTQEKQNQLTSVISLYTIAQQKGESYDLKWNATGEECVPWTIENLTQLALDIASYVQPQVAYQQSKEIEIKNCTTSEEVAAVVIEYVPININS